MKQARAQHALLKRLHIIIIGFSALILVIVIFLLTSSAGGHKNKTSNDAPATLSDTKKTESSTEELKKATESHGNPGVAPSKPFNIPKSSTKAPVNAPLPQPATAPKEERCNQIIAKQATDQYTTQRLAASDQHFDRLAVIDNDASISASERDFRRAIEDSRWKNEISEIKYAYNAALLGAHCSTVN